MSDQFEDKYRYHGKAYSYIESNTSDPFYPKSYGLNPDTETCSACCRGYFSNYSIIENKLYLMDLFVETKDGQYPQIAEVEADFSGTSTVMGYPVYKNLSLLLPYTGKMLVGNGLLKEYYRYFGFQEMWAYRDVKEFIFENGELKTVNDLSDIAAKLRKKVPKETLNSIFFSMEKAEAMKPYLKEWWSPVSSNLTLDEILLENSKRLREQIKKMKGEA